MFFFFLGGGGGGERCECTLSFIYSGIFIGEMIIRNFTTFAGRQAKQEDLTIKLNLLQKEKEGRDDKRIKNISCKRWLPKSTLCPN